MPILALDFDGVLCDSVDETAFTAWRAGMRLWDDLREPAPAAELRTAYRQARPAIETGYQAILVMRLLCDGEAPEGLIATFAAREPEVLARAGADVPRLKTLFAEARDQWLATAPTQWLALSPLYPGISEGLSAPRPEPGYYIVTTKERRFVERLLAYHGVTRPPAAIYGLEVGRPKEAILAELAERHPGRSIAFVEDRLATLLRCRGQPGLERVAPYLAGWGYNTETERRAAADMNIPVLELARLRDALHQENHLDR